MFSSNGSSEIIYNIFVAENESGIFMIEVVDITKEYIEQKKSYLVNTMFEEILEEYFKDIKVNENVLESINI